MMITEKRGIKLDGDTERERKRDEAGWQYREREMENERERMMLLPHLCTSRSSPLSEWS